MFKKSEVLKAIETQFKKDFAAGLGLIKPQWDLIAMKVSSNTKVNTYGFLGQFPKMVEWVNKRQRKAMQAQGTSIENKLYESTVGIPRTDIEDDQVGLFRPMVQQAAQSAAELPDDLVFGLLKAGKTTLCYDGQNYFDTDHPVFDNVDGTGSSKEQSNITTGTKTEAPTFYIFDTTNAIKPLIGKNAQHRKSKRNLIHPSLTPYLTKIFTNGVCVHVVLPVLVFGSLPTVLRKQNSMLKTS